MEWYLSNLGGQRIAVRQGITLTYLHADHLGSASLATRVTGTLVSQRRYLPYGETRWSSGTLPTDRRYTGQRAEVTLGVYDYGARFYSPGLGQFLSADTLVPEAGRPQALNRYSYTINNPLKYIDPTGHDYYDPGCDCMVHTKERTNEHPEYTYAPRLMTKDAIWRWQALTNLKQAGPICQQAANYMIAHEVQISFNDPNSLSSQIIGDRPHWTLGGNISLASSLSTSHPNNVSALTELVHETKHLEQGVATALSVYGELEAWQTEAIAEQELGVVPLLQRLAFRQLLALPPSEGGVTVADLRLAVQIMIADQPGYLVTLLPLYPIHVSRLRAIEITTRSFNYYAGAR